MNFCNDHPASTSENFVQGIRFCLFWSYAADRFRVFKKDLRGDELKRPRATQCEDGQRANRESAKHARKKAQICKIRQHGLLFRPALLLMVAIT